MEEKTKNEVEVIKKVLNEIIEPEIGKSLIESGMVKKIEVKGKKAIVELLPLSGACAFCWVMSSLMAEMEEKLRKKGFEPEVSFVFE